MTGALDGPLLRWLVVVAVAAGLFGVRLSFIQVFEWAEEIPGWVERFLRLVPAAVLAALVVPDLVFLDGALALSPGNDRIPAAAVAAVVAWRTEDILWTLVVGMSALWLLTFVL